MLLTLDLIQAEHAAQLEEERRPAFTAVDILREFIQFEKPSRSTNVSLEMCVLSVREYEKYWKLELVDGTAEAAFTSFAAAFDQLDPARRSRFIFHLALWKNRDPLLNEIDCTSGFTYHFSKVHALTDRFGNPSGSIQLREGFQIRRVLHRRVVAVAPAPEPIGDDYPPHDVPQADEATDTHAAAPDAAVPTTATRAAAVPVATASATGTRAAAVHVTVAAATTARATAVPGAVSATPVAVERGDIELAHTSQGATPPALGTAVETTDAPLDFPNASSSPRNEPISAATMVASFAAGSSLLTPQAAGTATSAAQPERQHVTAFPTNSGTRFAQLQPVSPSRRPRRTAKAPTKRNLLGGRDGGELQSTPKRTRGSLP